MDESNTAFSSVLPDDEAGETHYDILQSPASAAVYRSPLPHHDGAQYENTTTSTAERLKLSVSALIAGRHTPAADHFTGQECRPKGLAGEHLSKDCYGVTILDGAGGTAGWGTEGLLGTKKDKRIIGVPLGLPQSDWANIGGSVSATGVPYVAMGGTVTDSPAAGMDTDHRAEHMTNDQSDQGHERQKSGVFPTTNSAPFTTPSPSSRSGLVGRLGSALQSWAGRGSGDSNSRREGRPGPLGAKYTTEQHATPGYSPFEPPPHQQLKKRLPVEPAFTVASARGTGDGAGLREIGEVVDGAGRREESERRGGMPREESKAENDNEKGMTTAAKDEKGGQTQGGETAAPCSPCLTNVVVDKGAAEAGAEAGAGSTPGRAHTDNGSGSASLGEGSIDSSEVRARGPRSRMITPGLWELKAERSRLEQALVKAEEDRDVEKLRAAEAASRLNEAVARLESLRPVAFVR